MAGKKGIIPKAKAKKLFSDFQNYLNQEKTTAEDIHLISTRKSRPDFFFHRADIDQHFESNNRKHLGNLVVESRKNDISDFGFKLFVKDLVQQPFFYFDSKGIAHRNKDARGVVKAKVTTPHFNTYNSEGIPEAFKTDFLNDENPASKKHLIQECICHFCDEAKILSRQKSYLNIQFGEIVAEPNLDVNQGVRFEE